MYTQLPNTASNNIIKQAKLSLQLAQIQLPLKVIFNFLDYKSFVEYFKFEMQALLKWTWRIDWRQWKYAKLTLKTKYLDNSKTKLGVSL